MPPSIIAGHTAAAAVTGGGSAPWAWTPHPGAWVLVALLAIGYASAIRSRGPGATRRQVVCFGAGLVALVVAVGSPLTDLAQRWSLLAHMAQMSLLLLAVPPLLIVGVPRWLADRLTEPEGVDTALGFLCRPLVATVVFNVTVIVSLLRPVVEAQARSATVAASLHAALLVAGAIMWIPALRAMPGARQMGTPGRMGYLFLQSLLANFPALLFIFAHHAIYPTFAANAGALGLSPLTDQQAAGALAKLVGIGVLWGTAAAVMVRAQRAEAAGADPDPLKWEDVERELRRAERRRSRMS